MENTVTITVEAFQAMVERYTKAECEAERSRNDWYRESVRADKLDARVKELEKELENGRS